MPRRAPHEPPHFARASDEWQRVQLPERFPIRSYRHQVLKRDCAPMAQPPPRGQGGREALQWRQTVSVFSYVTRKAAN